MDQYQNIVDNIRSRREAISQAALEKGVDPILVWESKSVVMWVSQGSGSKAAQKDTINTLLSSLGKEPKNDLRKHDPPFRFNNDLLNSRYLGPKAKALNELPISESLKAAQEHVELIQNRISRRQLVEKEASQKGVDQVAAWESFALMKFVQTDTLKPGSTEESESLEAAMSICIDPTTTAHDDCRLNPPHCDGTHEFRARYHAPPPPKDLVGQGLRAPLIFQDPHPREEPKRKHDEEGEDPDPKRMKSDQEAFIL